MFRTPICLSAISPPFSMEQPFLNMGSCFADVMGERMQSCKFRTISNPLGVLYHPMAIFKALEFIYENKVPPPSSYLCHDGVYYNYHLHSELADTSQRALENLIAERIKRTREHLMNTQVLILTFGTAYQYILKEQNLSVANCHKQPAALFTKECCGIDGIVKAFTKIRQLIRVPRILLSVSPVRHLRDGLVENSLSKSLLRVACQEMVDNYPEVEYFPGYEIVMDDLRDYRFFEKDMIHPNQVAHDYIWDLFVQNYLDKPSRAFIDHWLKIQKNLQHRPFHSKSEAHQKFLKKTLGMLEQVPAHIDVSEEVAFIKEQII